MILLIILLALSVLVNVGLAILLRMFMKKLLQFDEVFGLLGDDVMTNISFFDKLLSTPLFMASPEIEEAHKNMNLMRLRLQEYALRIGETRGPLEKKKEEPDAPRPIVVD